MEGRNNLLFFPIFTFIDEFFCLEYTFIRNDQKWYYSTLNNHGQKSELTFLAFFFQRGGIYSEKEVISVTFLKPE